MNEGRALKNTVFSIFVFKGIRNPPVSDCILVDFLNYGFHLIDLYAKPDYFSSINFMLLLRFTANIVIALCISMPIRPDDDATP